MIILRYNMPIPEVDLHQVGAHEIRNAVLARSDGSRISQRWGRQLSGGGGAQTYDLSIIFLPRFSNPPPQFVMDYKNCDRIMDLLDGGR